MWLNKKKAIESIGLHWVQDNFPLSFSLSRNNSYVTGKPIHHQEGRPCLCWWWRKSEGCGKGGKKENENEIDVSKGMYGVRTDWIMWPYVNVPIISITESELSLTAGKSSFCLVGVKWLKLERVFKQLQRSGKVYPVLTGTFELKSSQIPIFFLFEIIKEYQRNCF